MDHASLTTPLDDAKVSVSPTHINAPVDAETQPLRDAEVLPYRSSDLRSVNDVEKRNPSRSSRFREDIASLTASPRRIRASRSFVRLLRPLRRRQKAVARLFMHGKKPYCSIPGLDGLEDQHEKPITQSSLAPDPRRGHERAFSSTHQQSLEEYEKKLTVFGDDRRRRSSVDLERLREVEEDDQNESLARGKHAFRRSSPLFGFSSQGGERMLMERALEKHQEEKAALFRFNGKQARSKSTNDETVNSSSFTMSFGPASSPQPLVADFDDIDPLTGSQNKRSKSMVPLKPVAGRIPTPMPQRSNSLSQTIKPSFGSVLITPPASWAKFSSHDRKQRCSSACSLDGIIIKDFANEATESLASQEGESYRKKRSFGHRLRLRASSGNSKLAQIWRYYVNLLGTGSSYNRRTSVTTSGRLKNPELEMLPSILPDGVSQSVGGFSTSRSNGADNAHEIYEMRSPWPLEPSKKTEIKTLSKPTSPRQGSNLVSTIPRAQAEEVVARASSIEDPFRGLNDPALAIDGASDALDAVHVHQKPSAYELSKIYQRECVQTPTFVFEACDVEEASYAADVPLPESPIKDAPSAQRRFKSPRQRLPAGPRPLNSPRATLVLHPKPVNGPETFPVELKHTVSGRRDSIRSEKFTRKEDSPPTSNQVSIRRFPSVTVVDDGKGEWRSVSLISKSSVKQRTETSVIGGIAGTEVLRPPSANQNLAVDTLHSPCATIASVSSDRARSDVRASTTSLLLRTRDGEERELDELRRLLTAGLCGSPGWNKGQVMMDGARVDVVTGAVQGERISFLD